MIGNEHHMYHNSLSKALNKVFFQVKKILTFFLFLHETCCGTQKYHGENENPQNMILWRNEPAQDKTYKMACAPSKDLDQPGHMPSLVSLCCLHEESLGP